MKPTLVGGVGYRNLSDMSLGPIVMEELRSEPWPQHVVVEDLSVGPVAVVHWLTSREPRFERMVVFAAAARGRPSASLHCYRWDMKLPSPDEVQERVAEAVTGVVDLDNLLVVTHQFEALPNEVYVIEVEPEVESFGLSISPRVQAIVPELKELARRLAESEDASAECEVAGIPASGSGAETGTAGKRDASDEATAR